MTMQGISRQDKVLNTTIRQRTKVTDIRKLITQAKWRAGHTAWTTYRWTRKLLTWRDDKRSRGRPRRRWSDDIRRIMNNWINSGRDRKMWRKLEEAYVQLWTRNGWEMMIKQFQTPAITNNILSNPWFKILF